MLAQSSVQNTNICLQVHVERGRLQSFLRSAESLKVHGLCDHQSVSEFNKVNPENFNVETTEIKKSTVNSTRTGSPVLTSTKKLKRSHTPKPVTATISPAFPLRPSSCNSPKPGPSNRTTESPIAVKVEEQNFSDEENHPEHVVIPSDPNSIGGKCLVYVLS